jgi:hypothetical protein
MLIASVLLLLLCRPHTAELAEQEEIRVHFLPLHKPYVVVAEERFVDNGDGTVTDTRRKIMWQRGDNGKEVTFEEAERYCKNLRLGGYADWRLPNPEERDTALVMELMMPKHSRDVYAYFDLYWSSDSTVLLPFNYRPSYGKEVSRVYFAREGTRAFVRAVRSLGVDKPDSGS